MWLAPVQAKIIPIADRHHEEAFQIAQKLKDCGIRVEVDDRSEKLGYKLREAQLQKLPYMLVVGDKEIEDGTVSVRRRGQGDIGAMKVEDYLDLANEEINSKKIS